MTMPRIGVVLGRSGGTGDTWTNLREQYARAVSAGVDSVWLTQHLGFDALTAFAAWGAGDADGPELGTAIVPIPSRHPLALAQQALTAQAAVGGRLALGIGMGHRAVLDKIYGLSTPRSVAYLRDYLDVLQPLLAGDHATGNETFPLSTKMRFEMPAPPPVLVAALGPRMLELTGSRTAGTITWMTGPRTLAEHTVPTITRAAIDSGRPSPRIVACLPVSVTDDAPTARQRYADVFGGYASIPSYAAMLDREGLAVPGDIAIVGNDGAVTEAIQRMGASGVTDIAVMLDTLDAETLDQTWQLISDLAGARKARR